MPNRTGFLCACLMVFALVVAGCGEDGSTPAEPSRSNASPTASVSVTPSGTALAASTTLNFTATANDPDGDSLTYNWNFGDGGTASGPTASHVFPIAGAFNVVVTVTDGRGGSVTASTTVTVRTLSGRWRSEARAWIFELTQNGTVLTGLLIGFRNETYSPPPPLVGTVGPGGRVQFQSGAFSITFTGTAATSVNSIQGTLFDCVATCRDYGEVLTRM